MKKLIIIIGIFLNPFVLFSQWYELKTPDLVQLFDIYFFNKDTGYISYFLYDPDPVLRYAVTNNNGNSWSILQSSDTMNYARNMMFSSMDTGIIQENQIKNSFITHDGLKSINKLVTYPQSTSFFTRNKYTDKEFFAMTQLITYKSDDYCDTWKLVLSAPLKYLNFLNKNEGYALNWQFKEPFNSVIYKTSDGGSSWQKAYSFPNRYLTNLNMITKDTGYCIFSATYWESFDSVFKTCDGGKSWQPIMNGVPKSSLLSVFFDLYFADSKTGYLLQFISNNMQSIYKTIDGGDSWHWQQDFNCGVAYFKPVNKDVIFLKPASQRKCVYYTINGGGPVGSSEENYMSQSSYSVYPNPVGNSLIIKSTQTEKSANMYLLNLQGQLLLHQKLYAENNSIDISNCPKGIYFVKIVDESGVWVSKVMKE